MGEAALKVARAAGYSNLGTVEFLADSRGNFFFLEVNTRLQVEHPVTELVTGYDLVQLQLRIAAGEPLPFDQKDVAWRGWAMECRVCAEDPDNQFFPSAGRIDQLREPSGPGVRLDSSLYPGWTVPLEYDSLLAKLVTWGPDRNTAIGRIERALSEYAITGVETNIAFFREILDDPEFRAGNLSTVFVADFLERRRPPNPPPEQPPDPANEQPPDPSPEQPPQLEMAVALAAAAHFENDRATPPAAAKTGSSRWLTEGRVQLLR